MNIKSWHAYFVRAIMMLLVFAVGGSASFGQTRKVSLKHLMQERPSPYKSYRMAPMNVNPKVGPDQPAFVNPPTFDPADPYLLTVMQKQFTIGHIDEGGNNVTRKFNLLCYDSKGSSPVDPKGPAPVGPTIRVQIQDGPNPPDVSFSVRLSNQLAGSPDPGSTQDTLAHNVPHGLCTTNLHTHGLHVSPEAGADNIFVQADPGCDVLSSYTLKNDHPSGTFWYHPHKHGSVAYQMSNGMAGAIIVERPSCTDKTKQKPNSDIRYLEQIFEIGSAKEQILIMQLMNYRVIADPNGVTQNDVAQICAQDIYNTLPAGNPTCCDALPGFPASVLSDPNPPEALLAVNGQAVPTLTMSAGELQRWRMIQGSWDATGVFYFADAADKLDSHNIHEIVPAKDLEIVEVAVDGLATGRMDSLAPKGQQFEVAPGQRSDLLVKVKPGTAPKICYLRQYKMFGPNYAGKESVLTKSNVAVINIVGDVKEMNMPPKHLVAQCRALPDLRTAKANAAPPAFQEGVLLNGLDVNQVYNVNYRTFDNFALHAGDQNPALITVPIGDLQEWRIKSAAPAHDTVSPPDNSQPDPNLNNHPFHIHVNPFQVIARIAGGKREELDTWRDTLLVKGGEEYIVRMKFQDYTGLTVFHCHILDHEDQGMMAPFAIVDKDGKFKSPFPPSRLTPTQCAAPSVPGVTDVFGKPCLFTGKRPQPAVVVFILGVDCEHCVQELKTLIQMFTGVNAPAADIIAVSSNAVGNRDDALKLLGATGLKNFQLVDDSAKDAKSPTNPIFTAFGCVDAKNKPLHGLYLINRDGNEYSTYQGHVPFSDAAEVVKQVKSFGNAK